MSKNTGVQREAEGGPDDDDDEDEKAPVFFMRSEKGFEKLMVDQLVSRLVTGSGGLLLVWTWAVWEGRQRKNDWTKDQREKPTRRSKDSCRKSDRHIKPHTGSYCWVRRMSLSNLSACPSLTCLTCLSASL